VDPSQGIEPVLTAYSDPSLQNMQSVFYNNDMAHFSFAFVSDMASIDSVTFSLIQITKPDTTLETIYDITQDPAEVIADISFSMDQVNSFVGAGEPINVTFSFQLSSSKMDLGVINTDVPAPLTVSAAVDIVFHGNSRKRTVSMDLGTATKTAYHGITFHHSTAQQSPSSPLHPSMQHQLGAPRQDQAVETQVGSIWAELKGEPAQASELDSWFNTLENSGDSLTSSVAFLVACLLLLVHIIA